MIDKKIEFRVWDTKYNCFFKPTYQAYKGLLEDLHIGLGGDLCMRTLTEFKHMDSLEPGRFRITQYIGIDDKEGKKIYEGDWVVCCRHSEEVEHLILIEDIRKLSGRLFGSSLNRIEKRGNVYENPNYDKEFMGGNQPLRKYTAH